MKHVRTWESLDGVCRRGSGVSDTSYNSDDSERYSPIQLSISLDYMQDFMNQEN